MQDGNVRKRTNHSGGTLGGMSDGSCLILRAAVKPTASIARPQHTVNESGEEIEMTVRGRHDPVIVPRAVVVVESMTAVTIADLLLQNMSARLDRIKDFITTSNSNPAAAAGAASADFLLKPAPFLQCISVLTVPIALHHPPLYMETSSSDKSLRSELVGTYSLPIPQNNRRISAASSPPDTVPTPYPPRIKRLYILFQHGKLIEQGRVEHYVGLLLNGKFSSSPRLTDDHHPDGLHRRGPSGPCILTIRRISLPSVEGMRLCSSILICASER